MFTALLSLLFPLQMKDETDSSVVWVISLPFVCVHLNIGRQNIYTESSPYLSQFEVRSKRCNSIGKGKNTEGEKESVKLISCYRQLDCFGFSASFFRFRFRIPFDFQGICRLLLTQLEIWMFEKNQPKSISCVCGPMLAGRFIWIVQIFVKNFPNYLSSDLKHLDVH